MQVWKLFWDLEDDEAAAVVMMKPNSCPGFVILQDRQIRKVRLHWLLVQCTFALGNSVKAKKKALTFLSLRDSVRYKGRYTWQIFTARRVHV